MRRTITIVTIILTGLVGAPVAAAHTSHKPLSKCPPKNQEVIDADAQAVVYSSGVGILGCAYGAKRSYYFGPPPFGTAQGSGGTFLVTLVGPVVAYAVEQSVPFVSGHDIHEVWVRNLRTGKVIHRMPTGSPSEPEDIGIGDATSIVVKTDGSVAWIVGTREQLGTVQVRSADKTGSHVLAISPEIAPYSLALAGSTLYWTQGGEPMSATLN